jgi:hypothetical protein
MQQIQAIMQQANAQQNPNQFNGLQNANPFLQNGNPFQQGNANANAFAFANANANANVAAGFRGGLQR